MKRVVCQLLLVLMCLASPLTSVGKSDQTTLSNTSEVTNTITAVAGADLSVAKERATLSTSWLIKLFSIGDLDQKKSVLIERMKKATKADVIIDPQFLLEKKPLGGGKLTLTGYPARYTNFRNLTPTEVDSLILHNKYRSGTVVFFDKSNLPDK